VHGDAGADTLDRVAGTADGGAGDDHVYVYGGDADGGSVRDYVEGDHHGDVGRGGAGGDSLNDVFGVGDLTLDGGSARDTCDLNGSTGDTLKSCEVVV
jgi:hypothetical protein